MKKQGIDFKKATGMCPHGNIPNQCPNCREERLETLRNWLDALPYEENVLTLQVWNQILESVSRGDDDVARHILDASGLKIPVSIQEVLDLAKSTASTVGEFWTNSEVAKGYSEAASEDDGSLMQLDKLGVQHPDLLELNNGAQILDLGSGTGLALRKIKSHFPKNVQIFGSDISEAMHEKNLEKDTYRACS